LLATIDPLVRQDARKVLALHPAATLVLDVTGKIQFANDSAANALGAPVEALTGARIEEIIAPLPELLARLEPQNPDGSRASVTVSVPNGGTSVLGYQLTSFSSAAWQPGYILVFRDITDVEELRAERDRLLQLAAVASALPSMLHEIKNPLAAVTTAAEVSLDDETADVSRLREDLHTILGELRRMKLSLEGVGLVGRSLPSSRHAAIDYAIREVCRLLEPKANGRRVSLAAVVEDMPLLPLDLAAMRAVLFNLINNAIQACGPDDRITVTARLAPDRQTLCVDVADTGPGMPDHVRERAFELFFTTKPSGSGIGLALCREIIASAGGEVVLKTKAGEGTQVSLCVPIPAPNQKTPRNANHTR